MLFLANPRFAIGRGGAEIVPSAPSDVFVLVSGDLLVSRCVREMVDMISMAVIFG